MSSQCLGVKTLKPRLSRVLTQQILRQLPSLLQNVQNEISDRRQQLKRLGFARTRLEEQWSYLLQVTQNFSALIKSAVSGVYNDPFFINPKTEEDARRRLRVVVQNTLTDLEEDMRMNVQTKFVEESEEEVLVSPRISRLDYIDEVRGLMRRSRTFERQKSSKMYFALAFFKPWTSSAILIGIFMRSCNAATC